MQHHVLLTRGILLRITQSHVQKGTGYMCFPAPFTKTLKRLTQYHWFRYPALLPVLLRPKFKKKKRSLFSQEFPHVSFDTDILQS